MLEHTDVGRWIELPQILDHERSDKVKEKVLEGREEGRECQSAEEIFMK